MPSATLEIELPDSDLPVTVAFSYTLGRPATMYKNNGDPGDPAEPGEVEVESVTVSITHVNHYGRRGKTAHYEIIENLTQPVLDRLTEQCDEYSQQLEEE